MLKIFKLSLLFFFLCYSTLYAQDRLSAAQTWTEIGISGRINKKLFWQVDLQYSRQGDLYKANLLKHTQQVGGRPWLLYYVRPNWRVSTFTGFWYNFAIPEVGAREFPEHRSALQTTYYLFNKQSIISFRFRIENRNIRNREFQFENVFRFRQQIKLLKPINNRRVIPKTHYIVSFGEFFVNGGSRITGYNLQDQARYYIGYGYAINDKITVETGYFYQFVWQRDGRTTEQNHAWQVTLYLNDLF